MRTDAPKNNRKKKLLENRCSKKNLIKATWEQVLRQKPANTVHTFS
jgi:hypothetical protein